MAVSFCSAARHNLPKTACWRKARTSHAPDPPRSAAAPRRRRVAGVGVGGRRSRVCRADAVLPDRNGFDRRDLFPDRQPFGQCDLQPSREPRLRTRRQLRRAGSDRRGAVDRRLGRQRGGDRGRHVGVRALPSRRGVLGLSRRSRVRGQGTDHQSQGLGEPLSGSHSAGGPRRCRYPRGRRPQG